MKYAFVAAFLAVSSVSNAYAEESIFWKKVGNWSVAMDPTMGNACYVATSYEGGTFLRLGFNFTGEKKQIFIAVGNADWKSLEAGKDYQVVIQFDNQSPWNANARAISFNGMPYLIVSTPDSNFANEFSHKLGMRIFFNNKQILALRLNSSSRAIDEMLNCQTAVDSALATKKSPAPAPVPKDPFQSGNSVRSANDPFDL